jgi:hypothetical protein
MSAHAGTMNSKLAPRGTFAVAHNFGVASRRRSQARVVRTTCKGTHWIERSNRWPACIQHISIGVINGVRARFLYCRLDERGQFSADCQATAPRVLSIAISCSLCLTIS